MKRLGAAYGMAGSPVIANMQRLLENIVRKSANVYCFPVAGRVSSTCRNPSLLPKPLPPAETNGGPRERVRRFVVRMPASRLWDYSTSQVAPERSRSSTQ